MRVLKVIPYYYPELKFGGPPLKVHTFARRLADEGASVSVVTFDSGDRTRSETVTIDGIEVRYLPWIGHGLRQAPTRTGDIAESVRKSDIVHIYALYNLIGPFAVASCRKNRKPFVYEPLGMANPTHRNIFAKRIYNRVLTRWMFSGAGRIIATSEAERDDLASRFPSGRLVVRRNGIDLDAFRNLPPRPSYLARHGFDPDERYLTYLGRISPIKNLEEAIRAFKTAAIEKCHFLLVGPATEKGYRERLGALVRELNLEDTVHFLPPVYGDEKLDLLAATDLLVLPSVTESFGNSAGEAVAAGIPVLVTTGCGIASLVDGRAGMAVKPDADSLAGALRTLLADRDAASRLTGAIGDAARDLSWDEPVAETLSLYRELVNDPDG